MSDSQNQMPQTPLAPLQYQPVQQPQPRPEEQEMAQILQQLISATSELAMSSGEITEDMIRQYPALAEVKDLILQVSRLVRRLIKLSRKMGRT
ncbi:MAG: hypothetical protein QW733_02030 [Desulfurococcaceae archaeon]|uniref:hypothetical protein n=1 Tax=Desulfurococcus sp. TaxID=51678 RepID=UPI0031690591